MNATVMYTDITVNDLPKWMVRFMPHLVLALHRPDRRQSCSSDAACDSGCNWNQRQHENSLVRKG